MTSAPDVQNVPDVWGLLQSALSSIGEHTGKRIFADKEDTELLRQIDAALAQRDRFVLVPKEPTPSMRRAGIGPWATSDLEEAVRASYQAMLAASPKPEGKT